MTFVAPDGATPSAAWLEGPAAADAPAEVRVVYDEIAAYLRVPYLGPFWRALAWEPRTLARIWAALRPLLASRAFEREAAALRRAALIEPLVEMPSHQAFKGDLVRVEIDYDLRMQIANYNATVHYALGKTLLAATWLERRVLANGRARTQAGAALEGETIPVGIAPGAVAVPPLAPHELRGRVVVLLDEIARAHGHPFADEYFRALARLPDYLNAAWNAIRPVVRDEPYDERGRELVALATAAVARLPGAPVEVQPLDNHDVQRLRAVTRYFAGRHLPDTLIDVALIKGLTDGPEQAQVSVYDL